MGKTILITGASSGFGRLTAETLRNSGHKVFAGFRSTEGAKKQVADELKSKEYRDSQARCHRSGQRRQRDRAASREIEQRARCRG